MKEELHPAVDLLLARMVSHPEQFDAINKWTWGIMHVLNISTDAEAALIRANLRELGGQDVHAYMMKGVLG